MTAFRETAVHFGEEERLAGILTTPTGRAVPLALALVSAGLVPKFGPFRLYTLLARELAAAGVTTLRFDLGGIGDSRPATSGALAERTERDLRLAVDHVHVAAPGARIALGGLCSGAEDSLKHAAVDDRVVSVTMIDPFAFATFGAKCRFLLHRAKRRTMRAIGLFVPAPPPPPGSGSVVNYSYMTRPEATAVLGRLLDRGTRIHFVYTGGRYDLFNHPRQLPAMLPGLPHRELITVDHFPFTGHTQLLRQDRDALVGAIVGRLMSDSLSLGAGSRTAS